MPAASKIAANRAKGRRSGVQQRPLPLRLGELLLLYIFIALLAGRFTLSRLSEDASSQGFDLRFIFVTIGFFAFMIWISGAREYTPARTTSVQQIPFVLWALWLGFSATWAPQGARVSEVLLDLGFLLTLTLLGWAVMAHLPGSSLERVWTWLVVTGLIYFALAIASGPDIQGRYAAPGGGPNTFVRIMVVAAVAALYLAVVKNKSYVLASVPLFAVGAALSGSRGGLLSAAIVLVIFLIPISKRLGAKRATGLIGLLAIGSWAASFWRDGYLIDFVQRRFIQETLVEGYSSGRDVITDQAWEMFFEHPILGVGLDGFWPLQVSGAVAYEHPHNLVVATLAEAGLVGGLLLLLAIIIPFLFSLSRDMNPTPLFALVVALYFLFTAMFSGDYYDSRFMWFFFGIAVASSHRAKESDARFGEYGQLMRT